MSCLPGPICRLFRLKLTTLERQHQRHQHSSIASTSLPFVSSSPRLHLSVIPSQGAASAEATTPSVFFGSDLIDNPPCDQLRRDSASDVDDSPAFELVPTPRLPQSSVKTTPFKKNWVRRHYAVCWYVEAHCQLRSRCLASPLQCRVNVSWSAAGGFSSAFQEMSSG